LGAKGSLIYEGSRMIKIKAVKPSALVDPTGAGDAYRAGFIHGYVRGAPLAVCGAIASLVARLPVAHYGTQEHALTARDCVSIKKLLTRAV
jgi:adenosine kinase